MEKFKMTKTIALFVKSMRVDMGCSWGRVAEMFSVVFPDLGINGGQENGRQLCAEAEEFLQIDFDFEPEEREIILEREISVVDLETTGTDTQKDRIVSIAITRINLDLSMQSTYTLVNPEMEIPAGSTEVHKIDNEMVLNAPKFADIMPIVLNTIKDTDILTFNGLKFDIPLFYNECARAGHQWDYSGHAFPDAMKIYHLFNPRDLSAAHRHYLGEEMVDAHHAQADTEATARIFLAQLKAHLELPFNFRQLQLMLNKDLPMADLSGKFYYNAEKQICYKFGKYKDRPVLEIEREESSLPEDKKYSTWVKSSDFPADSKKFLQSLLTQQ